MNPEIIFIQNNEKTEEINFGIVQAGTTKKLNIEVKNIGKSALKDIICEIEDKSVKIIEYPQILLLNESKIIILEFAAPIDADKPLKTTIKIKGSYIV